MSESVFGIRQVNTPCPHCGSWYRRGNDCNKCGRFAPVLETAVTKLFSEGKPCMGKTWNSKLHRYVRHNEVITT